MNSSIATTYCGEFLAVLASFSNMGSDLFKSEKQTKKCATFLKIVLMMKSKDM